MDFIRFILEYAAKEWAVIKNAPAATFILFSLAFLSLYFAFHWRYGGVIETLKGKNDLLKDQVEDYRERLGLAPTKTAYSKLTNQELKRIAGEYAADLKEKATGLDKRGDLFELPRREEELQKQMEAAKIPEEKDRLQREFWDKASFFFAVERSMLTELYYLDYRPEIIVLRDEMIRRLSVEQPKPGDIYDRLTGPTPIHDIAVDLQRLADLLPERDSRK